MSLNYKGFFYKQPSRVGGSEQRVPGGSSLQSCKNCWLSDRCGEESLVIRQMWQGEPGSLAEALFCSSVFLMMSAVAFPWLCKHDRQKQLSGERVYLGPQHQGLSSGSLDPMCLEEHHGMGNLWHSKPLVPNTESRRWVGARCVPPRLFPKDFLLASGSSKGHCLLGAELPSHDIPSGGHDC